MAWKFSGLASAAVASMVGSVAGVAFAAPAVFVLPTPANNPQASYAMYPDATNVPRQAIIMDGIPIAFKYDDFWSYSGKVLASIQSVNPGLIPVATFGTYTFSTGTGTIDVNITSNAGGATNVVGPLTFQDPVNLSSNQQVDGWKSSWGGSTQSFASSPNGQGNYSDPAAAQGGTSTVGELLAYLQGINPTWSIPLIYADYNQTGGGDSIWLGAQVQIINPATGLAVASWELDRVTNAAWDQSDPTFNFGDIFFDDAANCSPLWNPATGVGCAGVTTSGNRYEGSHNLGSGHADFMAFAPDMDLSLFNPNYLFVVNLNVGCITNLTSPFPGTVEQGCQTNGGEEFGIIGGVGAQNNNPEPGALALVAGALTALGWVTRRRRIVGSTKV